MVAATDTPRKSEDQQQLEKHKSKCLKKGDIWYAVSSRWFNNWKRYADSTVDDMDDEEDNYPGPIDNSHIIDNGRLKSDALEPDDYLLVHSEVYSFLQSKYKVRPELPELPRKVVEVKTARSSRLFIEVFPLQITFRVSQRTDIIPFTMEFSKSDFGSDVIQKVSEKLSQKKVQIHLEISNGETEKLQAERLLYDLATARTLTMEVDIPDNDGKWMRDNKSRHENGATGGLSSSSSSYYSTYASYQKSRSFYCKPGLRGLNNLGNTCFMNSAIQCLSNVPKLTEYFRGPKWKDEINRDNPLGMDGEIAERYSDLIDNLWRDDGQPTFMPRHFKMAVGRFAPQFSGFQQQDAQELMAFLLDGLHEDLNRIKKKPYIEVKNYDESRDEKEVANESWSNYQKRNDSVIVDLFHGQLRSQLHCPECKRLSKTFDPFCYLSLPLPHEEVPIYVTVVPSGPTELVQYALRVNQDISHKEFYDRLNNIAGLNQTPVVLWEFHSQSASPRCLLPSSLNSEYMNLLADHSNARQYYFYAFEVCEVKDRSARQLVRIDFTDGNHSYRPWLVTVDSKYERLINDEKIKLIYDALLKDDQFLQFFPSLKEVANNNSELAPAAATPDDDDSEEFTRDGEEPMQTDGTAYMELDKMFTLEISRRTSYSTAKHLETAEARIKCTVPKRFFQLRDHESVANMKKIGRCVELKNCLDLFTKTEKLGERDSWYCNKCKKHQRATKKFDLWKLPDTLVIHIKRFGNTNRLWRSKLNTKVIFPLEDLNMEPWTGRDEHYRLVSVVNHFGSMGGGHYTAFARNKEDDQWYSFDDSSVTSVAVESVVTQNAYVLVYVKKGECEEKSNHDENRPSMMDTD